MMQDQALQQAHDLLDTVEAIAKMVDNAKIITDTQEPAMTWIDWETEKPIEGEWVIVEPENGNPYFLTYFSAWKTKGIKRWLRLPA
jgi:hypothetical protein